MKQIAFSLFLFLFAGLFEIAGGWLIWKWVRDDRPMWWGLMGGAILILYGLIPKSGPAITFFTHPAINSKSDRQQPLCYYVFTTGGHLQN